MDKTYLGDGVYADHDGYQVWIWIEDYDSVNERIALEPRVLETLFGYALSVGILTQQRGE